MRPDLDYRDVPLAVMAQYLGISKSTLWRRTLTGFYAKGVRRVGSVHYYQPRLIVGAVDAPKSTADDRQRALQAALLDLERARALVAKLAKG